MLFIICVSITLGVTLSINGSDKLGSPFTSHCFKRISIGERLIAYDVTRIIERNTVGSCEAECDIYKCTHFGFGIAADGNGTCELTTDREISRRRDPDFDLYQKTDECVEGKPTGYEKACYRRIISGKRLHERFIRHALPCNSLEACQHQCSIEKHFTCQGFNIRLDPARIGRGICELSSVATTYLDPSRDFVYDPEFAYYERDHTNELPNCGYIGQVPNIEPPRGGPGTPIFAPEENTVGQKPPISGGPYYGGDSYGPWSTGYGTADHGPWGSHGYGSGFYMSNNPSRGPVPSFQPNTPFGQDPYGYAGGKFYPDNQPKGPDYQGSKPSTPSWGQGGRPPSKYPYGDRGYQRPNRIPTYIIIDADANSGGYGGGQQNWQPYRPSLGYLPSRPSLTPSRPPSLPPSRPAPLPPRRPPSLPPPRPPALPPPRPPPPPPPSQTSFYEPPRHFSHGLPDKFYGGSHNSVGQEVCFRREHPGYRLNPSSIKGMYDTPTVLDCEAMCTKSPFECTGYSFRYSSSSSGAPNCLLTDSTSLNRETHLLPDRSCDVYFKMGTCLDFDRIGDTECFLKVASNRKINPNKVAKRMSVSGMSDCELACLTSDFFTCRSFTFRYGAGVIGEPIENCFLSDWPISALSHVDFVPAGSHEVYERGSYGHGCELDVGPPHIGPKPPIMGHPNAPLNPRGPWGAEETWRHFTLSGWPCRAGTQCQLNPEAGFWACEVEGGDREQWDYCCRPKHSCGFSRGYHYPWCYVGEAGPDQWRPCSEFYYPEFGNRYSYKPVQSHNPHPVDSYGPPRGTRPWNSGQEDWGPPSYWPISYLHADPPPNETYVWDPEEHHHHHHHYHYYEEHSPEHYHQAHEYVDESPKIKFKPCGHKSPYPRAIIQKLDLKNIPKAGDPGEQVRIEEKPRHEKKIKPFEKVTDSETIFGFSPNNRDKENLKNEIEFFSSTETPFGNVSIDNFTYEFPSNKRELHKTSKSNTTDIPLNKTKEVIKTVEKIIEASSTEGKHREEAEEKNETLTKVETKHPGFVTLSEIENSDFDISIWN